MSIRPTRRSLAFVLATVALAAPGLTGCGFDAATERPYTPAAGANDVSGVVDVLGAVVVSSAPGSGTFVATLANNDQQESQTFSTLAGGTGTELTVPEFDPIEIPRGGAVNLADDGGVPVTGDFGAGNFVSLDARLRLRRAGDDAGAGGPQLRQLRRPRRSEPSPRRPRPRDRRHRDHGVTVPDTRDPR